MKIGIDISQIVYGTGVSRYTKHLVENLLKIDRKNDYVFFFSSLRRPVPDIDFSSGKGEVKAFKFPPTFLEMLWNQLHVINIERFIGEVDIFHSSDWTQPPCLAKKVTTVHDVSFLHYPQSFPKKIIKAHKRRLSWVKKEVDLVIADSRSTKNDLIKLLGFDEKKIAVVYLGVDDSWRKAKDKEEIDKVKTRYGIKGDYLLTVGTLEPRKNLKGVIKAFGKVKQKNLKLVLVGKLGWGEKLKQLNADNKSSDVIITGFVPDEDLSCLYAGAKCFVYPSFYEGFGLPVLEAMAAGCPVVTSSLSSLPEIAGEAAVLVDPKKTDEIVEGIKKILKDKSFASQLNEKGKKQAAKFTWEKTARETLNIYKNL